MVERLGFTLGFFRLRISGEGFWACWVFLSWALDLRGI